LSKTKVASFDKAKKQSLNEARKKSKLDETLEKNEAFKLEERVIVFVMTLSKKDHKKELVKD